jgi:D-alanyl-D-alanine carboxypeptidase (penicillin-binding protein 5/6)
MSPGLAGAARETAVWLALWLALLMVALADAMTAARAQTFQSAAPHAYLFDVETRSALYQKAQDVPVAPASLVKLMTAAVLFDDMKRGRLTLESEFQISENAWRRGGAPSGGSTMFAVLNSRIKLQDLIPGLIVLSGNDAAIAIAEGIAGSEAAFVTLMNEKGRQLGLTRSRFANSTGFGHPDQRMTARESVMLADYLIRTHPEYYPFFGLKEFTWNRIRQLNRNPVVAEFEGGDGLKTGNITDAGFSLVGSAVQNDRRLIVAVLGLPTARERAIEARKLLEWGFRSFEKRTLIDGGTVVADGAVFGGASRSVNLVVQQPVTLLVPRGAPERMSARVVYRGPLRAPVEAGAVVGKLIVMRGDLVALELPVVTAEAVPVGTLSQRALDAVMALSGDWLRRLIRGG